VVGERRQAHRHALHRVDAGHRVAMGVHAPAVREVAGVAHAGRPFTEDVGAERQHHLGLGEVVAGVDRPAEGALGGGARLVRAGGLPAVPAGLGELAQHPLDQVGEGGRGHRAGEDAQPLAAGQRPQALAHLAGEGAPGGDPAVVEDLLRAVGIVEGEQRGLGEGVGGAPARRVVRVPLDLGRPPLVALGEHAQRVAGVGARGGEEEGLAGDELLGLPHIGDDLFQRLLGAAGQAGQRQRGARELEEAPARHTARPLRREAGKLAMEEVLEFRRAGELVEAAPEFRPFPGPQLLPHLFQVEPGGSRLGSGLRSAFALRVDAVHQIRSLSLLVRGRCRGSACLCRAPAA